MVTTLKTSEKRVANRGSKSVTYLGLNNLLNFAPGFFIYIILSLPVLHSNVLLFSSTSTTLVHVKHPRTAWKTTPYKSSPVSVKAG